MKKLALYVFIDAFGWEVYKRYGFLEKLVPNARRLQTTFGFSSAADPSILTGRYPDEHTHWSSFIYDPANSPFKWMRYLDFLPASIFDRWRSRRLISRFIKTLHSYTGYFELYSVPFKYLPYFDYLEKRDYFVPGGILATDTIFDWCQERGIPYYCSNWRHNEAEILLENKHAISEGKIKFAYVYLPHLDAVMHQYGPVSEQCQAKLKDLEQNISQLYDFTCRIYDDVSLYVISDHGMAPVHGTVDLIPRIEALGYEYGKDYVAFYDSTMARFWFMDAGAETAIRSLLAELNCGQIIEKEDMKALRVWFPHDKFGEIFYLMDEGQLLCPSFMGLKPVAGMHGYHPDAIHSYSMMLSNRDITPDITSITQIRKTMEMELA